MDIRVHYCGVIRMLQIYSKGCEYVIRALARMDQNDCKEGFSVDVVCKRARVPLWFTRKIFQTLARRGVLVATHGPGGGYRFKKDPNRISLLSMIKAVDGENVFQKCILGQSKCNDQNSCSVHATWGKVRTELISELRSTTIKQLMNQETKLHSKDRNGRKKSRRNHSN